MHSFFKIMRACNIVKQSTHRLLYRAGEVCTQREGELIQMADVPLPLLVLSQLSPGLTGVTEHSHWFCV